MAPHNHFLHVSLDLYTKMRSSSVLFFIVLACTLSVKADIFFNVDYSNCFAGQTNTSVSFKSKHMQDGWAPLLVAVWRASPKYRVTNPDMDPAIRCHDLHIHVQGKVDHNMFVDCETDVDYGKGDSGDYVSLFNKFQQLYRNCESTEIRQHDRRD